MALAKPFITRRFISYAGDSITTKVSLAIWLIDELTGKNPPHEMAVTIKEIIKKSVKNASGYYCFTDLENGQYTVTVQANSPALDWFSAVEKKVDIPMPQRKEPVIEIILKPKAAYPFPAQTTLVRGVITENGEPDGTPVNDADIYQIDPDTGDPVVNGVNTKTDHNGEFVLFFKKPLQKKVQIDIEIKKTEITKKAKVLFIESGTEHVVIKFPD